MDLILIFARKWRGSYQMLRYRNGFGLWASVRYGLWLAHGRLRGSGMNAELSVNDLFRMPS